jgi:hypothetical protein
MLSDAEQRRLAEIETSLRADDPGFAERFDVQWRRPRRRRIRALCAMPLTMVVTFIALAAGSPLVATAGLVATIAALGLWIFSRPR